MSEPLLKIVGLKKHFPVTRGFVFTRTAGWIKAVDGIDFCISEGQTFALVGESGCGKTTTGKVILRLENATGGKVILKGRDVAALGGKEFKEYRSMVKAVLQDPYSSLDPRRRVASIIAEPLIVSVHPDRAEIHARIGEVLKQVGLNPDVSSRYPHEFSGGQRQRIALARAIATKPRLIILDEPVSALDVSIRAQIMNLLKDLQEQLGITYLLIAHHLATVRYMSHTVGVMYLGKIVEMAPSETIFGNALHPYTQALLSAALPDSPHEQRREEIALQGEIPSPINVPAGCRFHPRCSQTLPICAKEEPELMLLPHGHQVACHLCKPA